MDIEPLLNVLFGVSNEDANEENIISFRSCIEALRPQEESKLSSEEQKGPIPENKYPHISRYIAEYLSLSEQPMPHENIERIKELIDLLKEFGIARTIEQAWE